MANTKNRPVEIVDTKPTGEPRPTTNAQISMQDRTSRQKLLDKFLAEEKVEVMISPMYAPYFGKIMPVNINGLLTTVPCDGAKYRIPASFAAEVFARIKAVDELQRKGEAMSNIQNNGERYIGERQIF